MSIIWEEVNWMDMRNEELETWLYNEQEKGVKLKNIIFTYDSMYSKASDVAKLIELESNVLWNCEATSK